MKILSAAEMREVDRLTGERQGSSAITLMENAGKSVAEFIRARFPRIAERGVVVLCGKGNNGGDGFVVARHLIEMGARPLTFVFADASELHGDVALNRKRLEGAGGELRYVRSERDWAVWKDVMRIADVVVDALLGTGIRGAVAGLFAEAIDSINSHEPRTEVVSVDIPSGLPADTGAPEGPCVRADFTVTFTAPKIGMFREGAQRFVGQLVVREIGSPPELVEELGGGVTRWIEPRELAQFSAPRQADANKGDNGHGLIVAGSLGKSGAAALASESAMRVGAGLVTVAAPDVILPIIAAHTPEIMTVPLFATETGGVAIQNLENEKFESLRAGKKVLAMGPGLGTHPETQEFIRAVVRKNSDAPVILDADGLNAFAGRAAELKDAQSPLALTPHPGEMARLLGTSAGDVQSRRLELAAQAAADWNCYVILKGHHTVVAAPSGCGWINSTGNPGMATGGTGDVLTGMLAGLTAQYGARDWERVLCFGVFLHGLAGDIASADAHHAPLIASDLIHCIRRAYKQFYFESGRG